MLYITTQSFVDVVMCPLSKAPLSPAGGGGGVVVESEFFSDLLLLQVLLKTQMRPLALTGYTDLFCYYSSATKF
jgi:hypothetical protein